MVNLDESLFILSTDLKNYQIIITVIKLIKIALLKKLLNFLNPMCHYKFF